MKNLIKLKKQQKIFSKLGLLKVQEYSWD